MRGIRSSSGCRRWSVPVIDHLSCEYGVQDEARNKAIEDQRVINLLQSRVDAGEGACEVVEDLPNVSDGPTQVTWE